MQLLTTNTMMAAPACVEASGTVTSVCASRSIGSEGGKHFNPEVPQIAHLIAYQPFQ